VDTVLETHHSRSRWRAVVAGLGVGVATAILLVALNIGGSRDWVASKLRAGPSIPKIESLAVLPLENLSGDPGQEYFADGMTEELITHLGEISTLRVISRTSVLRYKGTKKPLPEIAKELNVDAIVEGAVLRFGTRVRITAQLIDARTDRHLWAKSYEDELTDVITMQHQIAQNIAQFVQVELSPQAQAHGASARRVNPAAHEAYLKGRFHWSKRTAEGLETSLDYFQQAIEKDSNYAVAYSGLADSYTILANNKFCPPGDCYPKAKVAALRALEIDESLAEGHASLGHILYDYNWDWPLAVKESRRAIELSPSYAMGHHWHAKVLTAIGQHSQAIAEMKTARALDPLSIMDWAPNLRQRV
jgi:TolB-like protein